METLPPHQSLHKQVIRFSNGNSAQAVFLSQGVNVTDLVHTLDLPHPGVLMMIAGGASEMESNMEF